MISANKVIKSFKLELKEIYSQLETNAITELVFEFFLNFSKTDMIIKVDLELPDNMVDTLYQALERLKKNEPVQYILGETYFYNLQLEVKPGVLIPRQETEELVDLIIKENSDFKNLKILDIGTGSGCIAISLAANLNNSKITAFDISDMALEIALNNAELNNVNIDFEKFDILKQKILADNKQFDIIVSNPPYVLDKEKDLMRKNVLDYEPSLALFVANDDPLLFYREISNFTSNHLKTRGKLYFEINEAFGDEIVKLLLGSGFEKVQLKKDINGKNRIISAIKH